jgi:hypothetical protein
MTWSDVNRVPSLRQPINLDLETLFAIARHQKGVYVRNADPSFWDSIPLANIYLRVGTILPLSIFMEAGALVGRLIISVIKTGTSLFHFNPNFLQAQFFF